jgi:hypothetical protein
MATPDLQLAFEVELPGLTAFKCFERCRKSATMSRVNTWIKRAVWLLVIYGILYLLISPLPELGAAFSGKSALTFFALITYALLELFFLTLFLFYRPSGPGVAFPIDVLDKICLRLC